MPNHFLLDANHTLLGFLGVRWGDDATAAAASLGVRCETWIPWEGGGGFEACFDIDHPVSAFGRQAYVRLFRGQNRLEGLSLRFMECGASREELAGAVRQELHLKKAEGTLYNVLQNGEAVRLGFNPTDDSCELTVTGPSFGKAFAAYLLQEGFKNLASGLGGH